MGGKFLYWHSSSGWCHYCAAADLRDFSWCAGRSCHGVVHLFLYVADRAVDGFPPACFFGKTRWQTRAARNGSAGFCYGRFVFRVASQLPMASAHHWYTRVSWVPAALMAFLQGTSA